MQLDKARSLKLNMLLNSIKGLLSVIFPLITFPYVSKVLGVDNIGRYNFANSIISYFLLIAGLGINTYAIREGARIRHDDEKFSGFANQIFTINIYSTVISYILLFVCMLMVTKFHEYRGLLIVLSSMIVFRTIGIEWVYSIFEDYLYITIRSIIVHIVSLILLFLLVHSENDLIGYALITVISSVGSNVFNYFHAKKYCKVKLSKAVDCKKHLKSIFILFGMTVATTIYVSSDTTILGFLCDDRTVGIYSVSTKIYTIVKTILSSIIVVSIPRLSSLLGKKDMDGFNNVATDIYGSLLTVVLPAITGIIVLRRQIVLILSDMNYMDATSSISLLSIALFFCLGAWFWGQCILVPFKEEGTVFVVTVVSAAVNVILNFILIPFWKEDAAAITTIVAEAISFIWCRHKSKQYSKLTGIGKIILKVVIGCLEILFLAFALESVFSNNYIAYTIVLILGSIVLYGVTEIILKNEAAISLVDSIKNRVFKKS